MGAVFEARHVLIGRKAAIKVLHAELLDRSDLRAYFLREARVVNRINHTNIAEVYDIGETEEGQVFLIMELLEGERLAERISRGRLDLPAALNVVEQIAVALARAHDLGVVHRDLKPEHVFLVPCGGSRNLVKLIDFGLASLAREGQSAAQGRLLGTPGYIAPETLRGDEAGPSADLYALGVIFFEMVTGGPPFAATDIPRLLEQHRAQPAPDPCLACPGLDPTTRDMILRLLAKDPAKRYADAYRLLEDCRSLQVRGGWSPDPSPPQRTPFSSGVAEQAPDTLAFWALKSTLFARMAAVVYPGAHGPTDLELAIESLWQGLSRLCKLDGRLEVTESFNANERARGREAADEVALRIANLSRLSSRLHRRVEGAEQELGRLAEVRQGAESRLEDLRGRIDAAEGGALPSALAQLLREAGDAAARQQMMTEATAKVTAKIGRWLHEAGRATAHSERLRQQLRAQNDRLETELGRREREVTRLYSERAEVLAVLREAEGLLRAHFAPRRECIGLMAQLENLGGSMAGPEARPAAELPGRGSRP